MHAATLERVVDSLLALLKSGMGALTPLDGVSPSIIKDVHHAGQ